MTLPFRPPPDDRAGQAGNRNPFIETGEDAFMGSNMSGEAEESGPQKRRPHDHCGYEDSASKARRIEGTTAPREAANMADAIAASDTYLYDPLEQMDVYDSDDDDEW